MYLSQLILNPQSWEARIDLSNPYEMHRSLMRGFPYPLNPQERILFRLEADFHNRDKPVIVLVQSVFMPDWIALVERQGYLMRAPAVKSLDQLNIQPGKLLRFRLRANPSKRDLKSGSRVGLHHPEEQMAWLNHKAEQGGFSIMGGAINPYNARSCSFTAKKKDDNNSQNPQLKFHITINMVDFDGFLRVQEADKFLDSLKQGIGPAKGLGCGLLSLARAGE